MNYLALLVFIFVLPALVGCGPKQDLGQLCTGYDGESSEKPIGINGLSVEADMLSAHINGSLNSKYILPFNEGSSFKVTQENCSSDSHTGKQRYAYDFKMAIGTPVLAIREGVVTSVVENHKDHNGCENGENYIYIEHSDGTIGAYVHLTKDGALVKKSDIISQGQNIGLSGNTGCSTGAHLHLIVWTNKDKNNSVPILFSNIKNTNSSKLKKGTIAEAKKNKPTVIIPPLFP